jgi:hypothetical protein
MIIFGLMTLLLVATDEPFWAGVLSMLSCLCWQPGLLFTATALLVFSRYLTSWRDLRVLKVLAGAFVPLGLALIYFLAVGALGDFWSWTVTYNYQVYMPEGRETVAASLARLWYLINQVTDGDTFWVKTAVVGFLIYAGARLWARRKGARPTNAADSFKDSLVIAPSLYLAFKVINYPGIDDLIPLFPFIGLFTGFAFTEATGLIGESKSVSDRHIWAYLVRWIPVVPVLVLAVVMVRHAIAYRVEGITLQEQQAKVQMVADLLDPDDKIYVHGTLEILVLLNRPNMNPYILLDRGKDNYIASQTSGGFDVLIDQMRAQRPKLIAISRVQNVAHRDELLAWLINIGRWRLAGGFPLAGTSCVLGCARTRRRICGSRSIRVISGRTRAM